MPLSYHIYPCLAQFRLTGYPSDRGINLFCSSSFCLQQKFANKLEKVRELFCDYP